MCSIGMNRVVSELCYKGTLLQRNYWKISSLWSFYYNSFVKFHSEILWEPQHNHVSRAIT